MEHIAARFALKAEHTLHAQDVLPAALQQIGQPFVDLARIERPRILDTDGGDLRLVMVRTELAFRRRLYARQRQTELRGCVCAEDDPVALGRQLQSEVGVVAELQPDMAPRQQRTARCQRLGGLAEMPAREFEQRVDRTRAGRGGR